MSLISHSNGFTTKEPKKRFTFKFVLKIISVIILFCVVMGLVSNTLINKANEKKFIKEDGYVSIDNKKNYYNIEGTEKPTIIFESSSGMGISQWDGAKKLLADEFGIRSFAYDRDGFGFSDFTDKKSLEEQAKELKLILRKVAISGPFILVGEGYGSLVMTNFAKEYPELVAGVILIAPINERSLGNTTYYDYFEKDKFKRKLDVFISNIGVSNLINKYIGLESPDKLDKLFSEVDYNNYKILRATKGFNSALEAELETILTLEDKSQIDGMFKDVPYVIINDKDNAVEQNKLKTLGSENLTTIINSDISSDIISLEKPELILKGVSYILKNIKLKESSNP